MTRIQDRAGRLRFTRNKVDLQVDGPAAFEAMYAAVASARHSIHLEIYIFKSVKPHEWGWQFAQALREKAAQGVDVRLIYDPAGARTVAHSFFRDLRRDGIEVLEYNPLNPLRARSGWRPNRRDHRKLLVVDGRVAFIGGVDISNHYSPEGYERLERGEAGPAEAGWHDIDVRIEGPAAAEMQGAFWETWKDHGGRLVARPHAASPSECGDCEVAVLSAEPGMQPNPIHQTYLDAIKAARTRVRLANAYFMPDDALHRALCETAQRGVEVTLVLAGVSDFMTVIQGQRFYYQALLDAGVRIYELRDRVLHAKVAVVDGVWCTVGSYNLDMRSLLHAREINAVFLSSELASRLDAQLDIDVQRAVPIEPEAWQGRPLLRRAAERMVHRLRYWL